MNAQTRWKVSQISQNISNHKTFELWEYLHGEPHIYFKKCVKGKGFDKIRLMDALASHDWLVEKNYTRFFYQLHNYIFILY